MKASKVVIIILTFLLFVGPIFTYIATRKATQDSSIVYSIDNLSDMVGPSPNTGATGILTKTSRSGPLDGYTSRGNGTQVVTLTDDLFLLDGGINFDSLYINNPNGHSIRSASLCGF